MKYSQSFRSSIVRRMTGRRALTATALSREVGIPQQTLSRWLRAAGRVGLVPAGESKLPRRPQDWSPQEILEAVVAAAGLSDEELGAFLRRKGIHQARLEQWRGRLLDGLDDSAGRSRRSGDRRRIKALEKELRRKDKALAETAALLVLQKKVRELLEGGEDDTPSGSGA